MNEEAGHRRAEAAPAAKAGLTRRHLVAALLAGVALALTVVGRLTACPGCEYAILGVPLFAAGAALYLALAVLALTGASLRRIGVISLAGIFVQAGLVRFLILLGAPCMTCLAAAASLFALSVVCLWPGTRWRLAPVAVAILGVAALPLWSDKLVESERLAGLPEFARSADLRSPPDNATLVVVYEREACSFCKSFRDEYESRLAIEFGAGLVMRKVDAKDRRGLKRLPSFLIRAPGGSMRVVRGLPRYPDLAAEIRAAAQGD